MSIGNLANLEEVSIWSDLVATHWALKMRDPTDDEAHDLVVVARQLASERQSGGIREIGP